MTRTKKATWNFATGFFFTAATLVIGVLTTPLLVKFLGHTYYGIFQILLGWSGFLGLFELGVGGALLALFSLAIGRNDERSLRSYFGAGFRAYLQIGGIVTVITGLWVWLLPYLITSLSVPSNELRLAGLLLATMVLWFPLAVFRLLADARQRSYVVNTCLAAQSVLISVLLVIMAWLGWGLIGQVIATVFAQLPFVIIVTFDGIRDYPGIWRERPTSEATRAVWELNWPTFAFNVSGRVGFLSDNLIIGWLLGPMAVTAFFLTQRLATVMLGQLQGIGNATWAALVELQVQGHTDLFRQRLRELTQLVSGLSFCGLVPIAAYNRYFVKFWVGSQSFSGEAVSLLACLNVWLWAIFSLWAWPVGGSGKIRHWLPYALISTIINVSVSIGATIKLGVIGPLVGTLSAFICVYSWALPRLLRELFVISPIEIWREALAPMLWGIPYFIAVYWVGHENPPAGWGESLVNMALWGGLGLLLWWLFSLSSNDRLMWKARVLILVGRLVHSKRT